MRIPPLESRPDGVVRTLWQLALAGVLMGTILMASAQQASANVGEKIILRCTNGQSVSGFSRERLPPSAETA